MVPTPANAPLPEVASYVMVTLSFTVGKKGLTCNIWALAPSIDKAINNTRATNLYILFI
jgi:hypothetical protein